MRTRRPPAAPRRSPRATSSSISPTICSASSSRPWMKSQRGLSGTLRRTSRIPTPSTAPIPKASRQPTSVGEDRGVEEDDRGEGAAGGAEPVAAVDHQVDAAAHPGRDQLVDRRVDRRVLAADRRAGEEAGEEEVPGGEGEGGRHGGGDVDGEREQEELLAPEAVGQLAEEERAEAGAADVEGGRGADLAGVEGDAAARFGEAVADAADDRHLEPVEDPDGAEADHHHPVESRPGKSVQAAPGRESRSSPPRPPLFPESVPVNHPFAGAREGSLTG